MGQQNTALTCVDLAVLPHVDVVALVEPCFLSNAHLEFHATTVPIVHGLKAICVSWWGVINNTIPALLDSLVVIELNLGVEIVSVNEAPRGPRLAVNQFCEPGSTNTWEYKLPTKKCRARTYMTGDMP